jgi:FMN phosphatase YigB (HAD superfamily)
MKIFLDFDDVIFNAKRFKKDMINVFFRNGVTKKEFDNSYYTFRKKGRSLVRYYSFKKQIARLGSQKNIDAEKLKSELNSFFGDLKKYVFSDVEPFLSNFSKKDLHLITYGQVDFQGIKIRGTGLRKRFNQIIITKNKKADDMVGLAKRKKFSPKENIIFIDDHPEQIERAMKVRKKIVTFRLRRKEGRYSDLPCPHKDFEKKNLREVLGVIKKEKKWI